MIILHMAHIEDMEDIDMYVFGLKRDYLAQIEDRCVLSVSGGDQDS